MIGEGRLPLSTFKFCREAEKHIDDPSWGIFRVDDPGNPEAVDVEYVEENPGCYELRHNDTLYFRCVIGRKAHALREPGGAPGEDPYTIHARSGAKATQNAMDSLLSQNDRLQIEIGREREQADKLRKERDKIYEECHRYRDELRRMTIENLDSTSTDHMIHEGMGLAREMLYAFKAKNFMEELQERMKKTMPHLSSEDQKIAAYLFEKIQNIDAFRLPELAADTPTTPTH